MIDASNNCNQPHWLKPRFDSIPYELKALNQFFVWKAEWRKDRWTKPPYNARNGRKGDSTDSETWSTFDEAKQAYEHGDYTGIGIAMSAPLAGVDLDKCRNPITGEIAEWAMFIVRTFASYAEVSPSGTGLRILFYAKLPGKGLNRNPMGCHCEIYDKGKYLTLTGCQVEGTPNTIEHRQEEASQFYQWILDNTEKPKQTGARPVIDPNQKGKDLTDSEVMDCAINSANGSKFEKLWDGDISDYGNDESRADAAIVGLLCYHSLDDEQVERLWKASGLNRSKLDRRDYVDRTISFIRRNQSDVCVKAQAKPDGEKTKLSPVAIPRVASEFEDIVLLVLAEYEPIVTEEDKLTLLALIAIFNGRKTAAVSRGMLARRIRRLDGKGDVASSKTLDQFGGRRLTSLKKALKQSIKSLILTVVEHSKKRGFDKRTQKPKASRYSLDLSIFIEALTIARRYYDEWCDGNPRFKEWQGDQSFKPKPNPGKCREVAARQVARKYRRLDDPNRPGEDDITTADLKNFYRHGNLWLKVDESEDARGWKTQVRTAMAGDESLTKIWLVSEDGNPRLLDLKTEPDDFKKWVDSEKALLRAASKWAEATDDLTTQDRRVHAGRLLDKIKAILLHDDKRERRRLLLKLMKDKGNDLGEASFMDEGMEIVVEDDRENTSDKAACSHYSVNTNGDKQGSPVAALTEPPNFRVGPHFWHNGDADVPVMVERFAGCDSTGRAYVYVEGSDAGIPLDELSFRELSPDEMFDQMEEVLAHLSAQ